MDYGRRTSKGTDRAEEQEIIDSLKVSSHLDAVYESIHSGAAPKVHVPNYQNPTRGEIYSEIDSESKGLSMDFDSITAGMSEQQIKTAMADALPERQGDQKTFSNSSNSVPLPADNKPRFTISRNQALALKKYPTLVEFLGRPEGEKVARQIAGDMNVLMAELIGANSKEAYPECAKTCKAEKQNLRQYFQGADWICRVTASGPFRGDEAIYYSRDRDAACVLRRSESQGQVRYADISDQFNLIYEAEQGEISVIAETEEKVAEASAEQATSAEEGENDVPENEIMGSTIVEEIGEQS